MPYQQYGCSSCHAADRKLVGPAFRDIAARYRGRADAEVLLVAKVRNGGAGVWGQMAMPPHPTLPDGALHEMIRTILAQPVS
ncbi:MAG TPA: c-type cytochrome [Usitatibacteraceae bacterium]